MLFFSSVSPTYLHINISQHIVPSKYMPVHALGIKQGQICQAPCYCGENIQLLSITPTLQETEMRVIHAVAVKIITIIGVKQKGYALILKLLGVKQIQETFITSKQI